VIYCPSCEQACEESAEHCPRCRHRLSNSVPNPDILRTLKQVVSYVVSVVCGLIWLVAVAALVYAENAGQAIQTGFVAVMALMIVLRRR